MSEDALVPTPDTPAIPTSVEAPESAGLKLPDSGKLDITPKRIVQVLPPKKEGGKPTVNVLYDDVADAEKARAERGVAYPKAAQAFQGVIKAVGIRTGAVMLDLDQKKLFVMNANNRLVESSANKYEAVLKALS